MSSTVGLVSLALLLAYLISRTIWEGFKEAIQRRRLERSKRRKLERDKRKAERAFRREQALLKKTKKKEQEKKRRREEEKKKQKNRDINCPECNHRLRIPARHTGNTICPACDSIFSARKLTRLPYKKRGKRVDRQVQRRLDQVADKEAQEEIEVEKDDPIRHRSLIPGLRKEDVSGIHSARFAWAVETYTSILMDQYNMPEDRARKMATAYYEDTRSL